MTNVAHRAMIILDMDSCVSPTHGEQDSKHNRLQRSLGCSCYHPLFVFNQFGDLERCALRPATFTAPMLSGKAC